MATSSLEGVAASHGWQYLPVSFVLPPAASSALRSRVPSSETGDAGRGVRIAVRRADGAGAPIGSIAVRWDGPDGLATVHRIGWDAANGGSELAVRRAVAQLRGGAPA